MEIFSFMALFFIGAFLSFIAVKSETNGEKLLFAVFAGTLFILMGLSYLIDGIQIMNCMPLLNQTMTCSDYETQCNTTYYSYYDYCLKSDYVGADDWSYMGLILLLWGLGYIIYNIGEFVKG